MTKGIRDLRQIQIGFQTPTPPAAGWDTPVPPATKQIVGKCGMKKLVNRVFPTEATGLMSDHIISRYHDDWVMAELPITPGDEGLTYNQLPWYLAMGAVGGAGILPPGAPPVAQVWTFAPALATADYPDVATIRYGDNALAWQADCCFARNLVISAAFQAPWMIDADIVGQDMVENGAIEDVVIAYPINLETILGQMTALWLDPTCVHGTTPIEGSLIDWRLTIPGFHPKFFQDGVPTFSIMGEASRHLTLEATVEWDSAFAAAEHAKWLVGTPVYVELKATGGAIPLVVPAANYEATIDLNLMYESFETLDERDGNDIVKFVARTVYDVECGAIPEWQIIVQNGDNLLLG